MVAVSYTATQEVAHNHPFTWCSLKTLVHWLTHEREEKEGQDTMEQQGPHSKSLLASLAF